MNAPAAIDGKLFSIEFFPPNTSEGVEKLRAVRTQLSALSPAFFSVTHGAGGATREKTLSTVLEMSKTLTPRSPSIRSFAISL